MEISNTRRGKRMNSDKVVHKLKKKLRKLAYWQRIELMDWLNTWYSAMKEEEEELSIY